MIETSLVIWAVGFTGQPIDGLPFGVDRGVVPNRAGRVIDMPAGRPVPGVYCSGWVKRGASGVIGTNRIDSRDSRVVDSGLHERTLSRSARGLGIICRPRTGATARPAGGRRMAANR